MPIPDPKTWTSLNLMDQGQMQNFLQQLALWGTQLQSPAGLLNSNPGSVQGGAISTVSQYLNGVSGTQTVACANAASVMVEINFTGNVTLALSNLSVGIPVVVKATNSGGVAHTLEMSATTGGGIVYAISAKGSSLVDMVATGVSMNSGATNVFAGNSDTAGATPSLWLLFN